MPHVVANNPRFVGFGRKTEVSRLHSHRQDHESERNQSIYVHGDPVNARVEHPGEIGCQQVVQESYDDRTDAVYGGLFCEFFEHKSLWRTNVRNLFRFRSPGPGKYPVRVCRPPSLLGSERTRNGRNGISGMADLSSGLSEKRWFYKMRLGLARPTIGADAEGSRGLRRARRRNANQVWLVTHFSLSLT